MNPHAWLLSDVKAAPVGAPKVFSTFACGGGSSMGYKLAGCEMLGANDIDPQMQKHYVRNLKPKNYYLCPIGDLTNGKIELADELCDLDILDGSPPCSSFSMAGNREKDWGKNKQFREGQARQVLDDLFFDYLKLVDQLRPKISIAENVKGMIQGNAKGYCKAVLSRYRDIGYRPQLFLVNAVHCGVPQARERVFFCAVRADVSSSKLKLSFKHRPVSVAEATSDIVLTEQERKETAPTGTDHRFWALTQPGRDYAKACMAIRGKSSFFNHQKLHPDFPSPTITGQSHTNAHWSEKRKLSYREKIRIGSFPDDYWAESPKIGGYMIGMSVPPKMTKAVAEACIRTWI